jgi:hypothetical protein
MLRSIIRTLSIAALAGILFIATFLYLVAHAGMNRPSCDPGSWGTRCVDDY